MVGPGGIARPEQPIKGVKPIKVKVQKISRNILSIARTLAKKGEK
jgi:hypothetical protein